jgi:hypothetical protein
MDRTPNNLKILWMEFHSFINSLCIILLIIVILVWRYGNGILPSDVLNAVNVRTTEIKTNQQRILDNQASMKEWEQTFFTKFLEERVVLPR